MQAQENRVELDEEQLLFLAGGQDTAVDEDVDEQPVQDLALNVGNVFQADNYDAFDYDVDKALTIKTMFMANLSSADPVYDEVGPSYDSDILSEYVKDNAVPVVHSNVSSVLNDAYTMIYNYMYEPHAQSASKPSRDTVVENSLTAELATYKEQVELRSYVSKKDFKQKENKYLEDFLDMKSLKEKVEYRLFKQDQSLQRVHMLCRLNPYYNKLNKVAIGYKDPLCLTRAKQVQPALYNGHEIIKDNHVSAIVHNIEDTLEIAEITRRKINDKIKDPKYVTHKALTKEIKEMKDVFKELESEVAQNIVNKKHDEIQQKNIFIANDNLIVECLSKEVFYVVMNFELNVSRFTKMHVADTTVEARCLELEAELSNLRDKSHNDNHNELVNHFSNLEWNSFDQPIGIEEAYMITWIKFKKLLIKKYCPRTEVQKMEDEFYHLTVKGNDLKTYVRRFQELVTLCPTMVSDSEKMMEAFIKGLPRSIKGNVTASKPQTLEEAINIAQRLMDLVTKHTPVQVSSDRK
nr:reverse transcriptase domain-containing protein [Tanacetum cinerariifolium]